MNLGEVKFGAVFAIDHLEVSEYTPRLLALGFNKNVQVSLIRKSLFGGTYFVKVGQSFVALRKDELSTIYLSTI